MFQLDDRTAVVTIPLDLNRRALEMNVLGAQDAESRRKSCERAPLARMATREDLERPLLFLASEASSCVTGQDLLVDGGFTAW